MCLKGILYWKIKTIKAFGSQNVIFGDIWLGIGYKPVNIHTLSECLELSDFLPNFTEKTYTQLKMKLNFSKIKFSPHTYKFIWNNRM